MSSCKPYSHLKGQTYHNCFLGCQQLVLHLRCHVLRAVFSSYSRVTQKCLTSETCSGCPGEHKIAALGSAVQADLGATVALKQVLVVQENLKFEQRSVLQFNWVLVHRILSPIQVALFMVQAWPSHCDCLAMVNTVNSLKDELMVSPLLHCAASLQERVSNYNHILNRTTMSIQSAP